MTGTLDKMLTLVLVVVLAAALCAAGPLGLRNIEQSLNRPVLDIGHPSKEDYRIVNGETACRDQFRHHAHLIADDQWFFDGSLIKPTAILTEGYHVAEYKKFAIRLGTIFWKSDDSTLIVQSIWGLVHPEFNAETLHNNVAVVLLNVEVPLGKSIWPVKLPSIDEVGATFTGRRALISGFGRVNASDFSPPEILQFAHVTVISNDLCKKFHREEYIPDSTLCAGNDKTALCKGDVGGALVIKTGGQYKQIGISSYFGINCTEAKPGIYTRVTSFLEWIERAAGKLDDWGAAQDSYFNQI